MLSGFELSLYALWIFFQGVDVLKLVWLISLLLIVLICYSIHRYKQEKLKFPKHLWFWLIFPFILPFIYAFLGSWYYNTDNDFVVKILYGLIYLDLAYSIFLTFKFRRYWLFIVSVTALLILLAASVGFVSLMSIANDWL